MPKCVLDNDEKKIEVLRMQHEGLGSRAIASIIGCSKSTVNYFLSKETYTEWWDQVGKPIATGTTKSHHDNIERARGDTFILVAAQNNTYVHLNFLKTLEVAARHKNAEIFVGTMSYNKSGFQNLEKGDDDQWFDPKIEKYIRDEPIELADGLLWCGELNILPTAVNPMSGFQGYGRGRSIIIPHSKLQMESVATHKQDEPRMMYTTGAVTMMNYIQKTAGQKASHHHIQSALLVEVDADGTWFVRQLTADSDTGAFQDLDTLYTKDGVYLNQSVEAIVYGDLHSEKKDDVAYDVSFGRRPDSMLNVLKPKYQFVHDCTDFMSRNHHNIDDPYFRFQMFHGDREDTVERDMWDACESLSTMRRDYCQTVVVESNHDEAFKRWLSSADYKKDPANAVFFLKNQLALFQAIQSGDVGFSPFEYAVKQMDPSLTSVKFLRTDESFEICKDETGTNGIECGEHSHRGTNGARGSVESFRKTGKRYNIAHGHSATIKDGVWMAGVLGRLDMGYNKGHSGWSHSNIINFHSGKRQMVTIKNGKYRRAPGSPTIH